MVDEREELPLDELRSAWRGVVPPPPADGIEECDPETQAVVGWMRSAFEGLETPPTPVRLVRPRAGGARGALPLAAAASALVAAGLWLWMHAGAVFTLQQGHAEVAELHEPGPSDAELPEEPVVAALGPDRIEMRSGPVRLVLLQPADGR